MKIVVPRKFLEGDQNLNTCGWRIGGCSCPNGAERYGNILIRLGG
jgi:hypothetical protein